MRKIIAALAALLVLLACASAPIAGGGEMSREDSILVVVQALPAQAMGEIVLVNPKPFIPDSIHLGVWYWINQRIFGTVPSTYTDLQWVVADSIKSDQGWLAYGATVWGPPTRIVLEKAYLHNPYIICHEFVHYIMWSPYEESDEMYLCQELQTTYLPMRWWKPAEDLTLPN